MLKLIKSSNPREFYTDERCHVLELLNDDQSPQLSIARCRVEPEIITQLHALEGVEETYHIESGTGLMDDGINPPFAVRAGDSIRIAQNHPQRIRNTGAEDLIFMVICRPRFIPECYKKLDE